MLNPDEFDFQQFRIWLRRVRREKLAAERGAWKKLVEVQSMNPLHPIRLPPRRLASKTGRR